MKKVRNHYRIIEFCLINELRTIVWREMEAWKWRSSDRNVEALMVFKGKAIIANQSLSRTGVCSDKTRRIKSRLLIGSLPILTALLLLPLLQRARNIISSQERPANILELSSGISSYRWNLKQFDTTDPFHADVIRKRMLKNLVALIGKGGKIKGRELPNFFFSRGLLRPDRRRDELT